MRPRDRFGCGRGRELAAGDGGGSTAGSRTPCSLAPRYSPGEPLPRIGGRRPDSATARTEARFERWRDRQAMGEGGPPGGAEDVDRTYPRLGSASGSPRRTPFDHPFAGSVTDSPTLSALELWSPRLDSGWKSPQANSPDDGRPAIERGARYGRQGLRSPLLQNQPPGPRTASRRATRLDAGRVRFPDHLHATLCVVPFRVGVPTWAYPSKSEDRKRHGRRNGDEAARLR